MPNDLAKLEAATDAYVQAQLLFRKALHDLRAARRALRSAQSAVGLHPVGQLPSARTIPENA